MFEFDKGHAWRGEAAGQVCLQGIQVARLAHCAAKCAGQADEVGVARQHANRLDVQAKHVVTDLPEGERMTFATFQKYWQSARLELGLAPLKTRTRETVPAAKGPERGLPAVARAAVNGTSASDFRQDPEGI